MVPGRPARRERHPVLPSSTRPVDGPHARGRRQRCGGTGQCALGRSRLKKKAGHLAVTGLEAFGETELLGLGGLLRLLGLLHLLGLLLGLGRGLLGGRGNGRGGRGSSSLLGGERGGGGNEGEGDEGAQDLLHGVAPWFEAGSERPRGAEPYRNRQDRKSTR